ncbi:MAG: CBS domain-containing protein [Polyangiaceae bacterium]|nr:CBS domain-containing protein [Polyangiaceae bacterium]
MRVLDKMRHVVATCGPEDSLSDAARIMWDQDLGCLPVVDESHHVVALITDRDICMAAYTRGATLKDIQVASAMSDDVVTCKREDSLHHVERLMAKAQVRRIPVVDRNDRLVGIISLADIATDARSLKMPLAAPGIARTLASITERRWQGALSSS